MLPFLTLHLVNLPVWLSRFAMWILHKNLLKPLNFILKFFLKSSVFVFMAHEIFFSSSIKSPESCFFNIATSKCKHTRGAVEKLWFCYWTRILKVYNYWKRILEFFTTIVQVIYSRSFYQWILKSLSAQRFSPK